MEEKELWEEIKHIEHAMLGMHEALDRIIEKSSLENAHTIQLSASSMKRAITYVFNAKFTLVSAIQHFYHAHEKEL